MACFALLLLGVAASGQEPPAPTPAKTKAWNVGISEQGGMLVATVGGLYFSQYYNSVDIEADFRLIAPLWLGVSTGYAATLPSQISEATPLILPAWDSFHTDVHANLRTDSGWIFRISLAAWYMKIANVQLYQFFPGTDVGIAKQFQVGPIILEPGIVSTWQFRRDIGTAWVIGGRLRILF